MLLRLLTIQRVVSTNLAGFLYVSQEAARHMRQNGGGQIISISTTRAQQPVAGVTAALTSLTKGGVELRDPRAGD